MYVSVRPTPIPTSVRTKQHRFDALRNMRSCDFCKAFRNICIEITRLSVVKALQLVASYHLVKRCLKLAARSIVCTAYVSVIYGIFKPAVASLVVKGQPAFS